VSKNSDLELTDKERTVMIGLIMAALPFSVWFLFGGQDLSGLVAVYQAVFIFSTLFWLFIVGIGSVAFFFINGILSGDYAESFAYSFFMILVLPLAGLVVMHYLLFDKRKQ
jgi:hypothetical protein